MTRSDSWVVPALCPDCDTPIVTMVLLIVCSRCQTAKLDYEFLGDWRRRMNADTRAVWELEQA